MQRKIKKSLNLTGNNLKRAGGTCSQDGPIAKEVMFVMPYRRVPARKEMCIRGVQEGRCG